MKKLIVIFGAVVLMALLHSCSGGNNKDASALEQSDGEGVTLNGVNAVEAGKMIQHLINKRDSDLTPVPGSFWISKTTLINMVALMDDEIKSAGRPSAQDSLYGVPDGIRIMFASDPEIIDYPLKNSILLVSTKDNGPIKDGTTNSRTKRRHKDYYSHNINADLFQKAQYEIPCFSENCPGCELYKENNDDDLKCPTPQGVSRAYAYKMLLEFKNHSINTKSVWFEMAFWRTLSKLPPPFNGIRIYFARHPKSADPGNAAISERSTFVIMTTKREKGIVVDDFACYEPIKNYVSSINGNKLKPDWDPQDNGELCPDNCE